MKYQQEVHNIPNIVYFLNYIKKEALNTFLLIFANTKDFIDVYEENLLTDSLVKHELTEVYFSISR